MTRAQAVAKAHRAAEKRDRPYFVFFEEDNPDGPYMVGSEFDCETYFDGLTPIYCTDGDES